MTAADALAGLGRQRLASEVARHRHRWVRIRFVFEQPDAVPQHACRCGAIQDAAATRKGRSSRNRGNRRELEVARALGGEKVGQFGGPEDVRAGMFVIQSKVRAAFPTWMTAELDKLPRTGGRIPVLVVTGPAGLVPGDRRRRPAIAVVHLSDWADLHGDER
jgi:hypothetical protein